MTESKNLDDDYLNLMQSSGEIVRLISQVLLVISNKRVTLAEKGIRSELYTCVYWQSQLSAKLSELLTKNNYLFSESDRELLSTLNLKLVEILSAFLQASNHSLNYLEQYFEHDFWLTLSSENISTRLSEIHIKMQALL